MLMGRLPGSPLPAIPNAYAGVQRFAGAPLQPYVLPQPVPRPPVMPQPSAPPVAPLPAAIEAWRARLLAINPLLLSRQFGMPVAQIQQLLADPRSAMLLYQQGHSLPNSALGGQRGGSGYGSASSPESIGREIEKALRGYTDNPGALADIASNMAGFASGFGAVQSLASTAMERSLGLEPGTLGGMVDVRGFQRVDKDLIGKIGSRKPGGGIYSSADAFNDQRARNERNERDRAASRGAGPGGRGPKGGGAYGGMGGVGSHGV